MHRDTTQRQVDRSRARPHRTSVLCAGLAWGIAALMGGPAARNAMAQNDAAGLTVRDVCIFEISAYGQQVNARSMFRSTLPATIISQRPAAPRDQANDPMPIGLITFAGTPVEDMDVMLEFTNGRFVAHWPPGRLRSQRLLWAGLKVNDDPTDSPRISPGHWLTPVIEAPRLYAHAESRSSRGLLYDAEIQHNPQVKLTIAAPADAASKSEAGSNPEGETQPAAEAKPAAESKPETQATPEATSQPATATTPETESKPERDAKSEAEPEPTAADSKGGEYRLENTGPFAVHDFTFYLPAPDGQGWKVSGADEAPGVGKPEKKPEETAKPDPETVFESLPQADGAKPEGESKPEGDSKPADAAKPEGEQKPAADAAPPVAVAAEAAEVAAEEAPAAAAGDAAKVEAASTAAAAAAQNADHPAADAAASPAAKGPQFTPLVEVHAEPVPAEEALRPWRDRLLKQGLGEPEIEHVMSILTHCALRSDSAVAIYRLDAQTLEAMLPLEVTPLPETVVRVGLVVLRDCDPKLETTVAELITQLGDPSWKTRVAAQEKLKELSQAAMPKLTEAMNNQDVEIAYRAEQLVEELQNPQRR